MAARIDDLVTDRLKIRQHATEFERSSDGLLGAARTDQGSCPTPFIRVSC